MALRRAFLAVLVAIAAVACSSGGPDRAGALVRTTDDWARAIQMAPARRIVSLAPATTELVYALGLGDRLVGRTTWCDWPPAALAVTDVGAGIGPNVEAVAATHPDLVLLYATEANVAALRQLRALAIEVAMLRVDRVADLRRAARTIAKLAGVPAAGDSLVSAFDSTLAAASAVSRRPSAVDHEPSATSHQPSVYIDVQANPPLTVGAGSYLTEIVEAAGARNAFGDVDGPSAPVSLEAIVQRDPGAILVLELDTARAPDLAARPGWRAVRAVREGRVIVADGALFGRPSPRMPDAVRQLARRLAALERR